VVVVTLLQVPVVGHLTFLGVGVVGVLVVMVVVAVLVGCLDHVVGVLVVDSGLDRGQRAGPAQAGLVDDEVDGLEAVHGPVLEALLLLQVGGLVQVGAAAAVDDELDRLEVLASVDVLDEGGGVVDRVVALGRGSDHDADGGVQAAGVDAEVGAGAAAVGLVARSVHVAGALVALLGVDLNAVVLH